MIDEKVFQKLMINCRIDEITNCWIWIGPTYKNGYGMLFCNGFEGRPHRLIMEAKKGEQINHKPPCNNRLCFNPEHLYRGTQKENVKDAVRLGTHNICNINHNRSKNKK